LVSGVIVSLPRVLAFQTLGVGVGFGVVCAACLRFAATAATAAVRCDVHAHYMGM
jgi:hypothetical protein